MSRSIPRANALVVYFFTAVALAVFMLPLALMLSSSFKPGLEIFSQPPRFLFMPTLEHYRDLFTLREFHRNILNSLLVALGSTALSVPVGAMAGYALARVQGRGMERAAMWILSLRMLPPIAVVIPYYIIFKNLDLLDNPLALVIVYATANIPLTAWLMKGYFAEIPVALEEAAQVDGYGLVEIFVRIALPLAAPGLAVCAVFCFIFSWNEFLFAVMLTGSDAQTATVAVMSFWSSDAIQWGRIMAGSTIVLVPSILFVLTCQRFLVKGLTLGSVK